ncbi:hypothetical protein BDF20DRAFT_834498 [Mycotypha africana]|uniref:uncharacterized protein n=1 Tax=Mycotypha africana TaxID=64632 RepID=UPI0023013532|nr:uncharacterized protein BDF20DRAFT_834498 [Mycotypha africana]KAI8981820.1 hypothetical protein BDF20DRAFT_834498 [Mycotypha africana]
MIEENNETEIIYNNEISMTSLLQVYLKDAEKVTLKRSIVDIDEYNTSTVGNRQFEYDKSICIELIKFPLFSNLQQLFRKKKKKESARDQDERNVCLQYNTKDCRTCSATVAARCECRKKYVSYRSFHLAQSYRPDHFNRNSYKEDVLLIL